MTQQFVGLTEIAEMFQISRQRAHQVITDPELPEFPAPVAVLAQGRVWRRSPVERWGRANGFPGRGRRKSKDAH